MVAIAGLAFMGSTAASADDTAELPPGYVAVGDHVFGPEDGLEVTTESFEINPGDGTVGSTYGSLARDSWGASYANSDEIAWLFYRGTAKAAANVYSGKRIIQVCFWWTRGGNSVSGTTCANAGVSGGSWVAGPEAVGWTTDSLGWNDKPTIFNIKTTRIDPGLTP